MFATTACCLFDYSEEIKEVAEPMLKNLEIFYEKNKRFPTDKERDEMLLAAGCESVVGGVCEKEGREILVIPERHLDEYEYYFRLKYDDTSCGFGIYDDGDITNMFCQVSPCIHGLKQ